MAHYTARLLTGTDTNYALARLDGMLDALLRKKDDDPFNLHAILHGYLVCPDRYPEALRAKFRSYAASWSFSRPIGVSLNYELMRDGGGWIAAQEWPDLRDADGNDARRVQALCRERLMRNLSDSTRRNASEYDAPLYYGTDFMALRLLAEFACDAPLKEAARLTLEWMLVQTAAHWHRGYHITAAGRSKYWGSSATSPDAVGETTGMAYLLFGGDRPQRVARLPQCFWLAHPGRALPLDWLPAWQASRPVPRVVAGSLLWPERRIHVRKIAWITEGYGVASQREDGTPADSYLFKECRRTMLKWVSDKPSSTFTVAQANRRRPKEKIANAFSYGENPYAQVLQHEGTLLGVYDVPEDYGFWKLQAPFTTGGAIVRRSERDGWVLCHGGSVLFAFRSVRPARWGKPDARLMLDLLECAERRNAWILETSPVAPFGGGGSDAELKRFAEAVLAKTSVEAELDTGAPAIAFRNLAGRTLALRWHAPGDPYGGHCLVDGKQVDYGAYPLFSTAGAHQQPGGPLTVSLPGGGRRTYDFASWTVRSTTGPPANTADPLSARSAQGM
jgi:hypothetical protein